MRQDGAAIRPYGVTRHNRANTPTRVNVEDTRHVDVSGRRLLDKQKRTESTGGVHVCRTLVADQLRLAIGEVYRSKSKFEPIFPNGMGLVLRYRIKLRDCTPVESANVR